MREMISIVVPVYGCPEALPMLVERVTKTVLNITDNYEIILVNDGCPRDSWSVVKEICAADTHVTGINLTRNFGQVNATNAGIAKAKGDYVVLMDCDLQDPPEGMLEMWESIKKGNDIVFAARKNRKDNPITIFWSKLFYSVYNHLVDGYYNADISNFCFVTRRVVDEYLAMPEHGKSFTLVLMWMGFKNDTVTIEGEERAAGKSSYNFRRKINLAIEQITTHSNKPLLYFIKIGIFFAALSTLYLIYQLVVYAIFGDAPAGWMSLTAVTLLLGGIQLSAIGVAGIYIGNIFTEVKGRKDYLIQEILNDHDKLS